MPDIRIDCCYCFLCPFAVLKEVAEATGAASISELQKHVRFGEQCELCHPYVRRMLRSGEVVFNEIIQGEAEG